MISELEGEIITLVPATVGKIVPDGDRRGRMEMAGRGLQGVLRARQEEGRARSRIEPLNRFETYILNRADQALALAEAVSPECGVCLDAFHLNIEEADMYDAIRQGRQAAVRLPRRRQQPHGAAARAQLDWPKIVETLKEIGYDGALTDEFVAPVDRTPAAQISGRGREEPGRHLARAAEIHPGPRLEPARRRSSTPMLMRDHGRDDPAADQVTTGRTVPAVARAAMGRRIRHAHHARRGQVGANSDRGEPAAPQRLRPGRRPSMRRSCGSRPTTASSAGARARMPPAAPAPMPRWSHLINHEIAPRLIGRDPRDISHHLGAAL